MSAVPRGWILGFLSPTEFGGLSPRIRATFLERGSYHLRRYLAINALSKSGRISSLHTAIFAGMEREYCHPAATSKAGGDLAQKSIQSRELIVNGDSKSLEHPPDRGVNLLRTSPRK